MTSASKQLDKIASSFVEIQFTSPSAESSQNRFEESVDRLSSTTPQNRAKLATSGVNRERSSLGPTAGVRPVEPSSGGRRHSGHRRKISTPCSQRLKQRGVLVTASSDHEEDDDELAVPMPTRPARRVGVVGVPKLYHDSDEDFDTDLEDDFPKKLVAPPTPSDIGSQISFYKTMCTQFGVVPITAYKNSLEKGTCRLKYRMINDSDSKALSLPLQVNDTVHRLDLQDNILTSNGANWIAQVLRQNTTLTELNLADNRSAFSQGGALMVLCDALVDNRTVTTLDLSGNKISDKSASHIAYLLEFTRSLRSLNLSHNELCSEGGRHIGAGLTHNDTLQVLDLSWNHLRLTGTEKLANSLKENIALKKLYLSMNGFGLPGAHSLALALKENRTLLELDISNNRITMEGAGAFGKIFSVNDSLQVLRMGENPMQTQGSYAMITFIHQSKNSTLRLLDLSNVVVLDSFMDLVIKIKTDINPSFKVKVGSIVTTTNIKIESGKNKEIANANPLMIVVTYMESQRMRIVDLFKTWDADNSMSLTRQEFKEGLKSVNTPLTENQLDELIQMLDGDGNGEIELNELIQAIERDHKGIRRKAALAAKADGPFPNAPPKKGEGKSGPSDIYEEMEDMLLKRGKNSRARPREYDSDLFADNSIIDNYRHSSPLPNK